MENPLPIEIKARIGSAEGNYRGLINTLSAMHRFCLSRSEKCARAFEMNKRAMGFHTEMQILNRLIEELFACEGVRSDRYSMHTLLPTHRVEVLRFQATEDSIPFVSEQLDKINTQLVRLITLAYGIYMQTLERTQ